MKWAIINFNTNLVENVIIWDGITSLAPYNTSEFIQLEENELCGIGWLYNSEQSPRFTFIETEET